MTATRFGLFIVVASVALFAAGVLIGFGLGAGATPENDYWYKAFPVGTHLPVGAPEDAEWFIEFRAIEYDENWERAGFTCSYGAFVERIA